MLVGVVGMTTTIKVGEWGKSKCHETNIRDIEPFFKKKKMVIISILWLIFWILKKKGFFLLLLSVCLLLLWMIYTCHISCLFNFVY